MQRFLFELCVGSWGHYRHIELEKLQFLYLLWDVNQILVEARNPLFNDDKVTTFYVNMCNVMPIDRGMCKNILQGRA